MRNNTCILLAKQSLRALLFTFALVAPTASYADEPVGVNSPISELRAQFLAAETGPERGRAAGRLFNMRSAQELQNLCFDKDASVALCAAWHRLEIQMKGRFVGRDRGATVAPIPAELSREFLGFIEGRLRIPAPDVWTQNLLGARFCRWGAALFPATQPEPQDLPSPDETIEGTTNRSSLPQVLVSLTPPAYITFIGRESYEGQDAVAYLPDELVTLLRAEVEQSGSLVVTGLATERRAVIALRGGGPGVDELICVATAGSKANPRVLWRQRMDSYWADDFKGAWWFTEFRLKDDLLYLFHCTHDSIGIECVQFVDGKRVFAFNSRWP
jgi:hypothetical protein